MTASPRQRWRTTSPRWTWISGWPRRSAATAAKAALALALRESRLSRVTLAQRLGVDEKAVRRMLDPRHRTAVHRIEAALRMLGQELVVETRAA